MASYNQFNYNYRPAKTVERKIFVELLKELYGVTDAPNCTYIGFGSIFFSDFGLMHKELGINKMINIEKQGNDRKRFEYNKPFSCIDLKWGQSTDVLLDLDWGGEKIIWLDYDQTLQTYMFEDIEIVFSNVEAESFYFFTCNSSLPKYYDREKQEYKLDEFKNDFSECIPFELTAEMLTSKQSPYLIKEMITLRINHVLGQRNAVKPEDEKLEYYQLLFIIYQDGAPMFSTGGIILEKKDFKKFKKKKVFSLPYIKTKDTALDIQSPVITNTEIDLINKYLPKSKKRFLKLKKLGFIPDSEREKYYNIYRYYPAFVEIRDY